MTLTVTDRPGYRLTRHFFQGLFDLPFLAEGGGDALVRTVLGTLAGIVAFGLIVVLRLFMVKYAGLSMASSQELYRRAVLGDDAFLIGVAMLAAAIATVVVSASLFPDETDFRVLMVLPVTRTLVFGAKLTALALFVALFVLVVHAALAPVVLVMSAGRWAEHGMPAHALAFWTASLTASIWASLAIVAVNGLLMLTTPRARLRGRAAVLRSLIVCGLALAVPLVFRLSTAGAAMTVRAPLLALAPPVWFVGVERVLLGEIDIYFLLLTQVAVAAFVAAATVASLAYVVLYRRFDQVILRADQAPRGVGWRRPRLVARHDGFEAVREFASLTFGRSPLHQGIWLGLASCGVALVVNGLLRADLLAWLRSGALPTPRLVSDTTWAPLALVFFTIFAARAALVVPVDRGANWIFRITESPATRVHQMQAVEWTLWRLGVGTPVVLVLPLLWRVHGASALVVACVVGLWGLILVELALKDWRRIPFSCSYLPGKHAVAQSVLSGLVAFTVFTTVGRGFVWLSLVDVRRAMSTLGILLAIAFALHKQRRKMWIDTPLMFEDEMPSGVHPVRLSD
jgi:hypothetical protein